MFMLIIFKLEYYLLFKVHKTLTSFASGFTLRVINYYIYAAIAIREVGIAALILMYVYLNPNGGYSLHEDLVLPACQASMKSLYTLIPGSLKSDFPIIFHKIL